MYFSVLGPLFLLISSNRPQLASSPFKRASAPTEAAFFLFCPPIRCVVAKKLGSFLKVSLKKSSSFSLFKGNSFFSEISGEERREAHLSQHQAIFHTFSRNYPPSYLLYKIIISLLWLLDPKKLVLPLGEVVGDDGVGITLLLRKK